MSLESRDRRQHVGDVGQPEELDHRIASVAAACVAGHDRGFGPVGRGTVGQPHAQEIFVAHDVRRGGNVSGS